jgi:serine/threonine-protein kinase
MDTDRNLLFGVLALQADVITPTQFIEACTLWASRKETPLAELLVERGWLSVSDRSDVERLVQRKLHKHGGDARASLAEAAPDPIRRSLAVLQDPDVQQSLADLPSGNGTVVSGTTAYQPHGRERYLLTHLHARGGIGQVWQAHDTDLDRDVALKELRPEREDQPAIRARFLEEGRVTGQLEHPGIVPVYELARDPEGGRPFYTMRFIRGRTLQEAAQSYHKKRASRQAGSLELRELLTSFVALCNAVAYAHSRGVIHRDLKPQNVILGDFGEVMVVDWGLAKRLDKAEAAQDGSGAADTPIGLTMQGQVLGTPSYMSPEQAKGRLDQVDQLSDVYGLGAVLYEVLTGQPPFQGKDTQSVIHQVIHETVPPPRQIVAATSRAIEAICMKALGKRREDRYASALDLARDVEHFLADEPVSALPESLVLRARRWIGRHRSLATTAAGTVSVMAISFGIATLLLSAASDRERRARERAEANLHLAINAVDRGFIRVSEAPELKEHAFEELRRELLREAKDFYEQFVQQQADDPGLQFQQGEAYLGRDMLPTVSTGRLGRSFLPSRQSKSSQPFRRNTPR